MSSKPLAPDNWRQTENKGYSIINSMEPESKASKVAQLQLRLSNCRNQQKRLIENVLRLQEELEVAKASLRLAQTSHDREKRELESQIKEMLQSQETNNKKDANKATLNSESGNNTVRYAHTAHFQSQGAREYLHAVSINR